MAKSKRFSIWSFIFLLLSSSSFFKAQLVMEVKMYGEIMKTVHSIFNNHCIIFIHSEEERSELHRPEELVILLKYLSRTHIQTSFYTVETFKQMLEKISYFVLERPLIVLINDNDELRQQFLTMREPWITMIYKYWMIFFRDRTTVDEYFENIYVPFDCIFLVVQRIDDSSILTLTEVYKIGKNRELISNTFGTWEEENGLKTTNLSLYQRRFDLRGQTLKVTMVEDHPITIAERNSTGEVTEVRGFSGTIMQLLKEKLNCTIEYSESPTFGMKLPNGSWTGALSRLVHEEMDLIANPLMVSNERLDVIDFTKPIFSTTGRIFIKRPNSYAVIKWTAYIDPFNGRIWLTILIIILLSSSFILLSFKLSAKWLKSQRDKEDAHFGDTFFHMFGSICGQGGNQILIDNERISRLVIHLTGVVIVSAYSAALISFLTVKVFVMPFTTMIGLLEDGSYKLGTVKDSAFYAFFEITSDKIAQRIFKEVLEDVKKLPNSSITGLEKVCAEKNYAFFTSFLTASSSAHELKCKIEPLEALMRITLAICVQKRSPYRGIINSNILLLRGSGIMQKVKVTELASRKAEEAYKIYEVVIVDVLPLLALVVGGAAFSIFVIFIEKFHYSKFMFNLKTVF